MRTITIQVHKFAIIMNGKICLAPSTCLEKKFKSSIEVEILNNTSSLNQ